MKKWCRQIMKLFVRPFVFGLAFAYATVAAFALEYSTCKTWRELTELDGFRYQRVVRVSDPGEADRPVYSGFWFYDELQFDATGRYALAMSVNVQGREVTPADRGEIGYFDLRNDFKWTKVGETTAWNWQQGCRLQWRPGSQEILWNDRSERGGQFVCRVYDFKTGARRTLPRPVYDVSSDGRFALTHDFQRMKHGGTAYVGIPDRFADQQAPAGTGIEKMDMKTGDVQLIISLERMAAIAFPQPRAGDTNLYFFREGWNPSGTRFIAFLKDSSEPVNTTGWSISADGRDVRFFYDRPSHHTWLDDATILEGRYFLVYKDDGTGKVLQQVAKLDTNTDPTIIPGSDGAWILGDTYVIDGFQYLFMYHRPSQVFVPLAKLKNTAAARGIHRVDLHARTSRDGRIVSIDSSHEGFGRQLYIVDIGHILDNPPGAPDAR